MAQLGVKVVLEAEDRARAVLDQFGRSVVDLSEKSERGLVRMETAMVRTTRSVRQLAVPLVAELVPAMDTTVGRMASVVTGAAGLGTGLGAVALAGAGLAGVLLGTLLQGWRESAKATTEFRHALASLDVNRVSGQIGRITTDLEKLNTQLEHVERLPAAVQKRLEAYGVIRGQREEQLPGLRRALETRDVIREAEGLAQGELEAQRALPDVLREQVRLRREEAERRRQALQALREETRTNLGALSGLGEFGGFPENVDALGREIRADLDASAQARRAEDIRALRERAGFLGPAEGGEFVGVPDREQQARFREGLGQDLEQIKHRQALVDVERDRLAIARQLGPIVTQADAESARFAEIELDRRRQLIGVTDEHKMKLINLGAEYESEIVRQEQLRRTDPTVGMLAGINTLAEEWSSLGRIMESGAIQLGHTMQQSLARAFRGEEVGKNFFEGFKRIGSELLSQYLIGMLYRQLGLLGGGGAYPLGSVGVGGGTNVTGAPPAVLAGLIHHGYQLVGAEGGQTLAVPGGGGYGFSRQQQQIALLRAQEMVPGDPRYAGSVYVPDLFAYGEGAGAGTDGTLYSSQYTTGTAALGTAAAALALYGYYRGASAGPGTGYFEGILGGTATGALAGSAINLGTGTAVGAVVGAAVGAFAANRSLALGGRALHRQQRQRDAGRIAEQILAAINGQDIDEALSSRLSSGNSVGGLLLSLALNFSNTELAIFLELRGIQAEGFSYERLGSLTEFIAQLTEPIARQLLSDALARLQGIWRLDENVLFAYEERDPASRVSRRTYLPFTQLETVLPGRGEELYSSLFASTAQMRRAGADEKMIEHYWRLTMAHAQRRDIKFDLDAPSFGGIT